MNRIFRTVVVFASISILISSCIGTLPGTGGSLTIRFDLFNAKTVKEISDDFQQVDSGKVFLKQGGVTHKQANLIIDKQAKSGTCTLTDITVGSYDIILELYDAGPRVVYSAVDTVSIAAGDNGVKQMTLERYIGTLSLSGTWTEDIMGLASATAELKKSSTVIYGASLSLSDADKTVSGGFINVYPDTYELFVEVKDSVGVVKFDGTKTVVIAKGPNTTVISLVVKTGSIQIQVNGDATAPNIVSGPSYNVSGTDVTVTWTTDEPATSAVCYSQTQGFDYQSNLNWAPLGGDLTADQTSHSVTISGLTDGATYYYVVVSADASGNLKVSDEKSMVVLQAPSGSLDSTFGSSGIVTSAIGTGNNKAFCMVVQLDDKIVVAGSSFNGSNLDFALSRYDTSGSLDISFGSNGIVTLDFASGDDECYAAVLQTDGKILVGGVDLLTSPWRGLRPPGNWIARSVPAAKSEPPCAQALKVCTVLHCSLMTKLLSWERPTHHHLTTTQWSFDTKAMEALTVLSVRGAS